MKYIRFLIVSICFLCFASCQKINLRDYYFPLKSLREQPKVYEYRITTADTTVSIYWYYQTVVQGDSINFVGTGYDDKFQVVQILREQQVENGMKLKDLAFYSVDAAGLAVKMPTIIEGGAVFPFEVTDSQSVFVNVIHFADPKDSTHQTTLTRNRRFIKKSQYEFQNKSFDAALFQMKEEQSERNMQHGGWTHIYDIEEIYAQNIGLVYSKRLLGNGQFFETRLVDIITMVDLEKRFSNKK